MIFYQILDIFFIVFHTLFTLFNILGWIWKKTRKIQLLFIFLTAGSWVGLGSLFGYGFGYCPCTDWHWQVKMKLGHRLLPRSYIKYLIDELTGLNVDPHFVDTSVIIIFIIVVFLSILLNTKDFIEWRRKRVKENKILSSSIYS